MPRGRENVIFSGKTHLRSTAAIATTAVLIMFAASTTPAQVAWQPTKSVEVIVPAGTGGGADQMARMIQGIIQNEKFMAQPIVVMNKAGGVGAEGFLYVENSSKN